MKGWNQIGTDAIITTCKETLAFIQHKQNSGFKKKNDMCKTIRQGKNIECNDTIAKVTTGARKLYANNDKEVKKKCQQDKRLRRASDTTNRKRRWKTPL